MNDKTPLIHAAVSVAVQAAVGLTSGDWLSGGIAACVWWAAREHTQAEYRWIESFGWDHEAEGYLRRNLPWWGGFDPRAWDKASVLDFLAPVAACTAVYFLKGLA